MAYILIWSPKSQQALAILPKEIAGRVVKKANAITGNPHPFLERMVDYSAYKLRVGDYRAFMDIDEAKKELHVLNVKHRKHAYK
jgi:mRNA-degrading endonuclease RelE of RelBE toxin-antitoxin system